MLSETDAFLSFKNSFLIASSTSYVGLLNPWMVDCEPPPQLIPPPPPPRPLRESPLLTLRADSDTYSPVTWTEKFLGSLTLVFIFANQVNCSLLRLLSIFSPLIMAL